MEGSFLQGRKFERDLYVVPVVELALALGVPEGQAMKLLKAAYGLEAAVEWYLSIRDTLESRGWRRMYSDPCTWILADPRLGEGRPYHREGGVHGCGARQGAR